jgi:hypothetical protein
MSDIRRDFRRSARVGLIGVVVVAIVVAAIALAFGSGSADPTAVTAVILAVVFGFVVLLFYFQRRDLNAAERRSGLNATAPAEPVTDPTTVELPVLLAALAIEPIDAGALARSSDHTWRLVRRSQHSGWVVMVLIACAVVPWQLWQQTWSIVVFVPVIMIYAVYLAVRALIPGGDLDRAHEHSAATLEPLGLQPDGGVYTGYRHDRPVSIHLAGGATIVIGGAVTPFEVKAKGERLRAAPGAPAAVAAALEPLRASSYWKGVEASGGAEGVRVERRSGAEHWMRDLWLAERLADVATRS